MKSPTTFLLVVLARAPAMAQNGGMGGLGAVPAGQAKSLEVELLEMEGA
jgi:hypothetical protein